MTEAVALQIAADVADALAGRAAEIEAFALFTEADLDPAVTTARQRERRRARARHRRIALFADRHVDDTITAARQDAVVLGR